MGWVVMSERDLQRIGVLSEVRSGKRSVGSAAAVLSISDRHIRRLLDRFETSGGAALAPRTRYRSSNNKIAAGIQEYAIALIRERYTDFGSILAAEMLAKYHGLVLPRETLRQWMANAGLWLSRRQCRTFHQPRS